MKRIIAILVSLGILGLLYWKIDAARMIPVFRNSDLTWLVISLGMVIPITLVSSWRLCQLMPGNAPLGFWESNRLILLASVLNLVLPSKMGDMAKAFFMADRGHLKGALALSLVVFEKACDMASLLAWCAFGLCIYPRKDAFFWVMTAAVAGGFFFLALLLGSRVFATLFFSIVMRLGPKKLSKKMESLSMAWAEMHGYFWRAPSHFVAVAFSSIFLWFLHLLQIWLFTLSLRTEVPFIANLALSPLAILAGLLPLTFAGVGTRDAALVFLYAPYMASADAAALGVLCTMRYVLPAIAGLPFIGPAIASLGGLKATRSLRQRLEASH